VSATRSEHRSAQPDVVVAADSSSCSAPARVPCRIATGRAALQQVVQRCKRSCGVATGRAALQQVVQRCNRPCRAATGRAALQQVVRRCNRSCRAATGRAALQQVVRRCNRSCGVATGRAALQQVVPRCNRSCCVATSCAALQQVVLCCNRSWRVATGRAVLQLALPQRACATGRWCAASQCACRRPHNPNASGRTIPGRHPPRRVGPRLRGARRAPPPWRTSCGCAPCCAVLHQVALSRIMLHHVASCCNTVQHQPRPETPSCPPRAAAVADVHKYRGHMAAARGGARCVRDQWRDRMLGTPTPTLTR
jgi:hypothetical protein